MVIGRVLLLAAGLLPWLFLALWQVLALLVTWSALSVTDGLGDCFDNGAVATAAMLWLAVVPLPAGVCLLLRRWRRLGQLLLVSGLPLLVLAVGDGACPPSVLFSEDADSDFVPVNTWTVLAAIVVLGCSLIDAKLDPVVQKFRRGSP